MPDKRTPEREWASGIGFFSFLLDTTRHTVGGVIVQLLWGKSLSVIDFPAHRIFTSLT